MFCSRLFSDSRIQRPVGAYIDGKGEKGLDRQIVRHIGLDRQTVRHIGWIDR